MSTPVCGANLQCNLKNVNVEAPANSSVHTNMGKDKVIDKGTVDSGAPLNDDIDQFSFIKKGKYINLKFEIKWRRTS